MSAAPMKIEAALQGTRATPGRIPSNLLEVRDEMGEITAAVRVLSGAEPLPEALDFVEGRETRSCASGLS
jgi:hypothetical protein